MLKQEQAGHIDAELTIVLSSISLACKQIASLLQRSSIFNLTGAHGTVNIQGEHQKKLDIISNETYSGNYVVVFDPIDGSANIDTALTTGSIFGIYGHDEQCLLNLDDDSTLGREEQKCIISVCQSGSNLLAAGYCLYSSAVILTLSLGRGVNYDLWDDKLKKYLNHLKQPGANGKPYSGRYIGCLVGEIHRMLLCGGVYGNPKNKDAKNGNLRLLYECAPMSYLVEHAGGKATDGHQRILEIKPTQIHQRSPIFIGSPDEIEKLENYLA
ncbi:hypothetical protein ACSBR1_035384 [Camellia fascicularis]